MKRVPIHRESMLGSPAPSSRKRSNTWPTRKWLVMLTLLLLTGYGTFALHTTFNRLEARAQQNRERLQEIEDRIRYLENLQQTRFELERKSREEMEQRDRLYMRSPLKSSPLSNPINHLQIGLVKLPVAWVSPVFRVLS